MRASSPPNFRRPRVLLIAEDVTLAHVGRLLALAESLDPALYDVRMACGDRYRHFVQQAGLPHVSLRSMPPAAFADRLARGKTVHTETYLKECVKDDLRLLRVEAPAVVVGDFRVSLGISCELSGTPHIAIANAQWSPACTLPFPMPEHPLLSALPKRIAAFLFSLALPHALRAHIRPFNRLRNAFGLEPVHSLAEMYTRSNRTLYADLPGLIPVGTLPTGHEFIGPVWWEPAVAPPSAALPGDRPVVYATVGSSGAEGLLDLLVRALGALPVTGIVATAGRTPTVPVPSNVLLLDYVSGSWACDRAALVISNGGSMTTYQALAAGVPVLGIPSNADQHLAISGVVQAGAARALRPSTVTPETLAKQVDSMLTSSRLREAAVHLADSIARSDAKRAFASAVHDLVGSSTQHYRKAA